MGYVEMPPDAMQPHDTWIIAFCPDTNSFFATNQRAYFWEAEEEFDTEDDAVYYFSNNTDYFIDIENEIMSQCVCGWKKVDSVYFENTNSLHFRWRNIEE